MKEKRRKIELRKEGCEEREEKKDDDEKKDKDQEIER